MQNVDHPRHSGVFAERNHSIALVVHQFLVVYKADVLEVELKSIKEVMWKNN